MAERLSVPVGGNLGHGGGGTCPSEMQAVEK